MNIKLSIDPLARALSTRLKFLHLCDVRNTEFSTVSNR